MAGKKIYTRKIKRFKIAKIIALFFLFSCSANSIKSKKKPSSCNFKFSVNTAFVADKAIYNPIDSTIYIMQKNKGLIYVYKGKKQINLIGGFGFLKNQFQTLNDISISSSGNLIALDSFSKTISSFDSQGKFLAKVKLNNKINPILFDVNQFGVFCFWDFKEKVAVYTKHLQSNTYKSFGRFEINEPLKISCNINHFIFYEKDKTTVFVNNGRFLKEFSKFSIFDDFNNNLTNMFAKFTGSKIFFKNNHACIINNNLIMIYKINYEN